MRRFLFRFVPLLVMSLLLTLAITTSALAADTNCAACHDFVSKPNVDPAKFKMPRYNDGSVTGSVVDKAVTCKSCHMYYWTEHKAVSLVPVTVYGTNFGAFKSPQSIYVSAGEIHIRHSNLQGLAAGTCVTCHAPVSCNTCHATAAAPVPHENHYTGTSVNPKTGTPIITPIINSTRVGNSTELLPTTCAASECHQPLPIVVSRRSDGGQLCKNCHNADTSGHGDVSPLHTTVFNTTLNTTPIPQIVDCSSCHSNILNTEHANKGLNCQVCHSKTARAPVPTVVASAYGDLANRECSKCHNNPPFKHAPLHTVNTINNSLAVTGLHQDCNACHANNTVKPIITAQVAAAVPDYTCYSCHQGMLLSPIHVAKYNANNSMAVGEFHPSCNSCHSKTDSTINAIAKTAPTTGYSCADCHNGTVKPVLNPKHTAVMSVSATVYGQVYDTTQFHAGCATCHSNAKVTPKVSLLKNQISYSCGDCHDGVTAVKSTHSAKLEPTGTVKDSTGYHSGCNTCHGNPQVSAKVTALKGTNGYLCSECHNGTNAAQANHTSKMTVAGAVYNTVKLHPSCDSCHNNNTVKPIISNLKGQSGYLCGSCHTGSMQPKHQAKMTVSGAVYETTRFHANCETCHGNTNITPVVSTLKSKPNYLCTDCHNGTAAAKPGHMAVLDSTSSTQYDITSPGFHSSCEKCHNNPVVATKITGLKNTTGYQCSVCHDGTTVSRALHTAKMDVTSTKDYNTTTLHPTCGSCHGNPNVSSSITRLSGTTQAYTCNECHTGSLQPKHQARLTVGDTVYRSITSFHNDKCDVCHSNQGVVPYVTQLKKTPDYFCTDCHNGKPAKPVGHRAASAVTSSVYMGIPTVHNSNCQLCHTTTAVPTVAQEVYKLAGTNKYLCTDCHNGTVVRQGTHVSKYETISQPADTIDLHPTCSTCHESSRVANKITTLKGTANYSCVECHDNIPIKHTGTISDYPVNCTYCHSGQLVDTHITPTAINPNMVLKGTYDCATCHSVSKSPVLNQVTLNLRNCTACHGVGTPREQHPGSQYRPLHVVSQFPAILQDYSPNCASCHKADIITLHDAIPAPAGPMGCEKCHANPTNPAYKTAIQSRSADCTGCHSAMTSEHTKYHATSSNVVPVKTPTANTTGCLECHKVTDAVTGNVYTGLLDVHKKSTTSTVTCASCHGATVRASVAQAVYKNDTNCEVCHAATGHQHPVTTYEVNPKVDCASCHATDAVAKTTELSKLHKTLTCNSCHNPTFEGGTNPVIVKDGVMKVPVCATCHDGTKAHSAEVTYPAHDSANAANHSYASSFGAYSLAGNVSCTGCHTTMNIRPVHQTTTCDKCHTSTVTAVQNVIKGNWSRTAAKITYSCADCHNAVTTVATTNHKPVHTVAGYTYDATDVESCNSCHNTKVVTDLHVGKVNKAGQTMTCNSCHNSADAKIQTLISQQAKSVAPNYSCDSCHVLHGNGDHNVTLPVGLAAEPNLKCVQCHDNDPTSTGVTDLAAEHTRRVDPLTGKNYTCSTCHSSTKVEVRTAISAKNKNCNACHTLGWHQDLNTPHTSKYVANPTFQCSNCHANVLSSKTLHPDAVAGTTTIGGGPVSYKIFRGTDGISFTEVGTSSVNSFSNTGLTANTQYHYQVAAVDQAGNVSTKSNVAFATTVQQTTSTLNPTSAAYGENIDADRSSDGNISSLSPSALTRITDGKDSSGGSNDVRVQENSSSDRWIFVRLNQDAKNATKVVLNIRASWREQDDRGNILIYPYQANGTSINTSGVINYSISKPSYNGNFTTYSIDVTAAARTMDNFGFMKFRIKPGNDGSRREAYISEVRYVVTSGSATAGSGTQTGSPGSAVITGNNGDSTPPSTPTNLLAQGISSSQINLNWNASTDPTQTVTQTGQSNCLRCHDNTQPKVQNAITTQQTNCDSCHTVHGDVATVHNTIFVLNPTMTCSKCHQSRVDLEHTGRKSPTTGQQYTCDTCHKSTDPLVRGAIVSNNTKCDACHVTRHTNVQSVHVSNYIPDTTVDCAGCHTTTKAEFTNTANKTRHVIAGTTSLATNMGSYVAPYTSTTTLNCRECHKATNGTYYGRILVKPYTANTGRTGTSNDLCFLCHDFQAYGIGGSKTSDAFSGFSLTESRKNLHVIGDHDGGCQMCHNPKLHGQTSRQHFIVLKGETGAGSSATLTNFIHQTGKTYQKSTCSAGCDTGEHP